MCYGATFNQYWYIEDNAPIQTSCTTGGDIILPTPPIKYGYDFIGWEKLPYVPIEYLESTGTQYIDTGLTVNDGDISATAVFMPTSFVVNDTYACIFGINGNFQAAYTGTGTAHIGNTSSLQQFFYLYKKATVKGVLSSSMPQIYYVDNVSTGLSRTFNTDKRLMLLDAEPHRFAARGRLYSFIASRNNKVIMDLIPVLDSNGTPCMYDVVEKKFYYNAGTGQFIAGPVIGE